MRPSCKFPHLRCNTPIDSNEKDILTMIRLIASDIDGTLLQNKSKAIPEEIFRHIRRLRQKDILFPGRCSAKRSWTGTRHWI